MITLKVTGPRELIAKLERMPASVGDALWNKVAILAAGLQGYVVSGKLSGQVLNVRSGRLRRSIQWDRMRDAFKVIASVFSAGDVKYAGIHEFGGQTKPHLIMPKKAQALAFMMDGKQTFAKVVQHPGSKMPERSFLRSALRDRAEMISLELKKSVIEGLNRA